MVVSMSSCPISVKMEITVKVNYRNDKLRSLRRSLGLSQAQHAKAAGINVRVYQNYEQGVRDISKAQLSTLLRIYLALQYILADIITDPETAELLQNTKSRSWKEISLLALSVAVSFLQM